jgi:hypothetical protein
MVAGTRLLDTPVPESDRSAKNVLPYPQTRSNAVPGRSFEPCVDSRNEHRSRQGVTPPTMLADVASSWSEATARRETRTCRQ